MTSHLRRALTGFAAATALALAIGPVVAGRAHAVPPGGPGPNTPGTHSKVSPAKVAAGGTIRFTVSGYPAGEVLSIKIDDGEGYSNRTVQGSGVVYQQKIAANGAASGSFRLPSFVKPGTHWLRFLASEEFTDSQGNVGVNGYTNSSPRFTVVASSGGSGSSEKPGTKESRASASGSGEPIIPTVPAVVTARPASPVTQTPTASPTPTASQLPTAVMSTPVDTSAADGSMPPTPAAVLPDQPGNTGDGFPAVGVVVFALAVLGGATGVWLVARRRPAGTHAGRAPAR